MFERITVRYCILYLACYSSILLSLRLQSTKKCNSAAVVRMSTAGSGAAAAKAPTAAISLIKKGKMKVVQSLLKDIEASGDSHITSRYVSSGEYPFGVIKPIAFHDAIINNKGTVAILPEFNKKAKTGFIMGMPPPEIMGGVLRDAGSKAVIVSLDSRSGGSTVEEFERFCKEQAKARKFLPGPISIIYHDIIIDKVQITQAAAHGGAAVTLWPDMSDNMKEFVDYSKQMNIEPIVMIKSIEDGQAALLAGARYLCIHSLEESAILDLKNQLMASRVYKDIYGDDNGEGKKCFFIARLRPEEGFSIYHEIDLCWLLRDEGFVAVWPSPEAVYGTGIRDVYGNINAMRAKASRVFLSPRQFMMDRNKEGATEYLGDILY
jgi:indole-3-glycerol phosphate synthase